MKQHQQSKELAQLNGDSSRDERVDASPSSTTRNTSLTPRVTPTSLVQLALERNFPQDQTTTILREQKSGEEKKRKVPKMSTNLTSRQRQHLDSSWRVRLVRPGSFTQAARVPPRHKITPLI